MSLALWIIATIVALLLLAQLNRWLKTTWILGRFPRPRQFAFQPAEPKPREPCPFPARRHHRSDVLVNGAPARIILSEVLGESRSQRSQLLTGRMQFAVWELVEEGGLRPEPIEVLLAERLPLIAGATVVVVNRC